MNAFLLALAIFAPDAPGWCTCCRDGIAFPEGSTALVVIPDDEIGLCFPCALYVFSDTWEFRDEWRPRVILSTPFGLLDFVSLDGARLQFWPRGQNVFIPIFPIP